MPVRFFIHFVGSFLNLMVWSIFYPKSRFSTDGPEVLEQWERINEDMIIGDGVVGIREIKLDPPNIDTVVPPMRTSS